MNEPRRHWYYTNEELENLTPEHRHTLARSVDFRMEIYRNGWGPSLDEDEANHPREGGGG